MDRLLEQYAISLTEEAPNFQILRKIHKKLFEMETMTVIVNHHACLKDANGVERKINLKDPDWFRKLVL